MRHEIVLSPEAVEDLKHLSARARTTVRDAIELHLRHEPAKTSKSRIKRLRALRCPEYRLRVDDVRVFYDVEGLEVRILAIVPKSEAPRWLERVGEKT
ncbi:type II toxin-antitoxin system RelE/ParE family toxin [Candidatus Sumerlaeota bacterium]|nr:type II toxin-antitoxin system RelE/ParE family toxin [Candidatus Sumerlaeota bacterium]